MNTSGSTKAVVRLAETIEHQRQPTDKSCTATCIAMALGVPVQSLGVDFTHPYLPEAAAIWLAERGIWLRACDRNEQPRRHAVYLVGIRSLNTVNSDHSVLLDTRGEPYPAGDGMHCGWKFYDPNKGREGKQHTEWVDTNWFLDLYEFCERGRYREFGDAPRFSSEPGAAALGSAGYQMDETGFGTHKLTMGFPDMETLHAASDYVRRLRAAK